MIMNTSAWADIRQGIAGFRLWQSLARQDIRLKYRRSTLGPFWITLSMAVTVSAMGPLYGALFSTDLAAFVPHLALGLIFWAFIAGSISEYAETFTANEHILKQSYLPLSALVMRVFYRQLLILLHNLLIYPFRDAVPGAWRQCQYFLAVARLRAGVAQYYLARPHHRHFLYPLPRHDAGHPKHCDAAVFRYAHHWQLHQLPEGRLHIAQMNPFTSLITLLRDPVLGVMPAPLYWQVAAAFALVGTALAVWVFSLTRKKNHLLAIKDVYQGRRRLRDFSRV